MSNSTLLQKIEQCREEMLSLSRSHSLTSEAVITSSVKLDQLMNEYENKK
ncbi:Spo0E family sporulation regulatory protein-aspartic acid phosphatase [Oceanobacillus kapialis]|uniref:Spo0E family sporulation regulatory protein-aspartic acid phosphatase n=1 Tax=Oceanobacillus kapialis TaxID=481353 RepID=A0ABW5Q4J9_9BACI